MTYLRPVVVLSALMIAVVLLAFPGCKKPEAPQVAQVPETPAPASATPNPASASPPPAESPAPKENANPFRGGVTAKRESFPEKVDKTVDDLKKTLEEAAKKLREEEEKFTTRMGLSQQKLELSEDAEQKILKLMTSIEKVAASSGEYSGMLPARGSGSWKDNSFRFPKPDEKPEWPKYYGSSFDNTGYHTRIARIHARAVKAVEDGNGPPREARLFLKKAFDLTQAPKKKMDFFESMMEAATFHVPDGLDDAVYKTYGFNTKELREITAIIQHVRLQVVNLDVTLKGDVVFALAEQIYDIGLSVQNKRRFDKLVYDYVKAIPESQRSAVLEGLFWEDTYYHDWAVSRLHHLEAKARTSKEEDVIKKEIDEVFTIRTALLTRGFSSRDAYGFQVLVELQRIIDDLQSVLQAGIPKSKFVFKRLVKLGDDKKPVSDVLEEIKLPDSYTKPEYVLNLGENFRPIAWVKYPDANPTSLLKTWAGCAGVLNYSVKQLKNGGAPDHHYSGDERAIVAAENLRWGIVGQRLAIEAMCFLPIPTDFEGVKEAHVALVNLYEVTLTSGDCPMRSVLLGSYNSKEKGLISPVVRLSAGAYAATLFGKFRVIDRNQAFSAPYPGEKLGPTDDNLKGCILRSVTDTFEFAVKAKKEITDDDARFLLVLHESLQGQLEEMKKSGNLRTVILSNTIDGLRTEAKQGLKLIPKTGKGAELRKALNLDAAPVEAVPMQPLVEPKNPKPENEAPGKAMALNAAKKLRAEFDIPTTKGTKWLFERNDGVLVEQTVTSCDLVKSENRVDFVVKTSSVYGGSGNLSESYVLNDDGLFRVARDGREFRKPLKLFLFDKPIESSWPVQDKIDGNQDFAGSCSVKREAVKVFDKEQQSLMLFMSSNDKNFQDMKVWYVPKIGPAKYETFGSIYRGQKNTTITAKLIAFSDGASPNPDYEKKHSLPDCLADKVKVKGTWTEGDGSGDVIINVHTHVANQVFGVVRVNVKHLVDPEDQDFIGTLDNGTFQIVTRGGPGVSHLPSTKYTLTLDEAKGTMSGKYELLKQPRVEGTASFTIEAKKK